MVVFREANVYQPDVIKYYSPPSPVDLFIEDIAYALPLKWQVYLQSAFP